MRKYFPYLILTSALIISCTGSFFSIYGLGKVFGGHQVGATIIAFAFEFGNIITASALKFYWDKLPKILRTPMIIIVIILTILTSMGIYGYLSDGYKKAAVQDEVITKKTNLIKLKKENFENRINENKNELTSINNSIQELSKGYNQNTQTQQVVKGQVITNVIVGNKKGLENQINSLSIRKNKIDSLNLTYLDSIQRLELQIIEVESSNEVASELGPLKYLSDLTDYPMDKLINWLILMIVIVYQPLALMLIVTSMFAFSNKFDDIKPKKKSKPITSEPDLDIPGNRMKSFIKPLTDTFKPPVIEDDIPVEVDNVIIEPPKKKEKKKRTFNVDPVFDLDPTTKQIIETKPQEDVVTEEKVETVKPMEAKKKGKRTVIDTTLTPEIADVISKKLDDKKKV